MIAMAKTQLTIDIEKALWNYTSKMGVFGCFEVTIGWYGKERVDYMTYDTKDIWRCYEIKVSKSDFHSKAKKTFVGHFNYFVMPTELYEEVKDEIPKHIGVLVYGGYILTLVKRPKKQELMVDEQVMKNSLIRSLYRESEKVVTSENVNYVNRLKRKISKLEKDEKYYKNKWTKLSNALSLELGWKKFHELLDKYNL